MYHKKNSQKVVERKMMKKVKKQWVVASVSLFAFMGAGAVSSVHVSADDTSNQKHSQDNQSGTTDSSSGSSSAAAGNGDGDQSNQTTETTNQDQTTTTTQTASTTDAESAQTAAQTTATQTQTTDSQNSGDQSAQNEELSLRDGDDSQSTTEMTAAEKQALIDEVTADFMAGKELTNDKSDNYKAYWNVLANFKAEYDAKVAGYGTSTEDYTAFKATDPTNVEQTKKEADAYEQALKDKLNSTTNVSVHTPSGKGALNSSDLNKSTNQTDENKGIFDAYMAKQGTADAESGRFNGYNTSGSNAILNLSDDVNDSYSQAYKGAQAAMAAQFKDDKNLNSSMSLLSGSQYSAAYLAGYNDVVNQFNQGTVFVSNEAQFTTAVEGNGKSNASAGGTVPTSVKNVKLTNDIDFVGLKGAGNIKVDGLDQLTIDGQNHMIDFHSGQLKFTPKSTKSNLVIQNFQEIGGSNWYGPFALSSQAR